MAAIKRRPNRSAELIRNILDGDKIPLAKRKLASLGGDAVEPILNAITGGHGRAHSDRLGAAVDDLVDVLVAIAKKDSTPLAEAMAHHVPGLNAVVWALGHSNSAHAEQILTDLRDHEDSAIRHMAEHHLGRGKRRRPVRRPARKPSKRKTLVSKRKKPVAKKKKATRRKSA